MVTPLRSNSPQGLEVERERWQFEHRPVTTALSGVSSDKPISTDANTSDTRARTRSAVGRMLRKMRAKPLRPLSGKRTSAGGKRRAGFLRCLLERVTNLGPRSERHFVFHFRRRVLPTKRKLKQRTPAIIQIMIGVFFGLMYNVERRPPLLEV